MKVMAEYLSPGVYVEEFDSGSKPMEALGAQYRRIYRISGEGRSKAFRSSLQTFPTFKRKYGGYLSENEFSEYRFAVTQ